MFYDFIFAVMKNNMYVQFIGEHFSSCSNKHLLNIKTWQHNAVQTITELKMISNCYGNAG